MFFILTVICLQVRFLYAQNEVSSDTLSVLLETIRVEAAHSSVTLDDASMSVSYVRRSAIDITSRPVSSMDEITFTLPGIWISNRENNALGERMSVRGMGWRSQFGVRGIQVVVDDIPLTVADGQTILNIIDPAMIHSVELLRGPSATFWGNSSGGVLFLRTRPGPDAPAFRYRSYLGSYHTMKQEVQLSKQLNGIRWNAYGSYYNSEGFRDHNHSEMIRGGLSAGFDLGRSTRMEVRAAYSGMPYAEHPGSLLLEEAEESPRIARQNFADANAGKTFDQLMGGVSLYQNFNAGLLSITAYNTYRDLTNPLPFGYITVDRMAGGTRAGFEVDNLPVELQFGAEVKWQRDDRWETNFNEADPGQPGDTVEFDQFERVTNQALFAHAVLPAGKLAISAGLRADRMNFFAEDHLNGGEGSRVFATVNPSFGFTYKFNDSRVFANLSTSFESPTTTEFKNRPTGEAGFNRDLNPEKTIGVETGIRGFLKDLGLEYDLTLFNMRVTGLIIPFDEDEQGRVYYRNEGRTQHLGLESRISFQIRERLIVDGMYTYLYIAFKEGELEGNRVPGVTPHRLSATATLMAGDHRLSIDGERVGEYYTDNDNTAVNESYYLFSGRWMIEGFTIGGLEVRPFVAINNIFNVRYNTSVAINAFGGRYFEPGSDRSFRGGLSVHFQ